MNYSTYIFTNNGSYPKNEDSADYRLTQNGGVFVVADGLGGHKNGDLASQLVVKTIVDGCDNLEDSDERFYMLENKLLSEANRRLLKEQQTNNFGKSTIAVLLIEGFELMIAHAGDTRIYHLKNNEIFRVTQDHSVTYTKYKSGEINRRDINHDEDRGSLLRFVGDQERFKPEVLRKGAGIFKRGDAFLLCTDGFWENVYDEEILADYLKSSCPELWVEHMLLRIIPRMTTKSDNLTALAVFVQ